jgi:dihydrofolate synthase/folylpolyglutamate synthase
MTAVEWLSSLSPWPADGFGLGRMQALLEALGDPQDAYPAVHVVGTNGKSTATRTVEALLLAQGLSVGATVSPHVRSWAERITVDGRETDLERALARVRPEAERLRATQFETITAAGLGGRLDATNVLRTRVVLLTNVALEHTDVLGETREQIAAEKLAVAKPGALVVLPDREFAALVPANEIRLGGAREAAEAFLGREIADDVEVTLPGRLERRDGEVRDGAHNPAGARWLADRLQPGRYVLVASVLRDKDADAMLRELSRLGEALIATESSNARTLSATELAERARAHFPHVEALASPHAAVARAHELGGDVLITGSLYLLGDLAARETAPLP